jgi:hypothetical protein
MFQKILKKCGVYENGFNFYMEAGDPKTALDIALKGKLGDDAVHKAATTLYEKYMSDGEFKEAEKIATEFRMPRDAVKAARICDLRNLARRLEHESISLHAKASKLFETANAIQDSDRRNEEPHPAPISLRRMREEIKEEGEAKFTEALEDGYPLRAQNIAKTYGLGKEFFYRAGLAMLEHELASGNESYAAIIEKMYGIRPEDSSEMRERINASKAR